MVFMNKKKRVNKKKVIVFVAVVVLLFVVVVNGYNTLKGPKEKKRVKQTVKVEEQIDHYGYELDDNETSYYKELFKNLKAVLKEEEVDEEKYASLVGQLFLVDFFNLDNKLDKNDVGGLQFVYSSFQSDFENLAKESIYHYIESNLYGDRKQELPVVKEVSVLKIDTVLFHYLDQKDEKAYQIDLKIIYEKDLGYQENVTLVLVHHDEKLEIIKMTE